MTETDQTTDTTESQEAKDPHRASYSAATTRLRDEFRSRFNELMAEEMRNRGQEWKPRATDEQKAEATIQELLDKYPDLAVRFQPSDS